MNDSAIFNLFLPLFDDIADENSFPNKRPLLAHYTSLEALEKILTTNELWFSNPLFMNDLDEVKFGVFHGTNVVKENDAIKQALSSELRYTAFIEALDSCINEFAEHHVFDTYVFCLSEHDPQDKDGLLSMWRGYGGNGKGVAIIFDTSKLNVVDDSPLMLAQVQYGSTKKRIDWLNKLAVVFAMVLAKNAIPDDKIFVASYALFQRMKLFSLFSKHDGFREEKEWRAVYLVDRDIGGKLKTTLHYLNGPQGVEPKLKLKMEPIEGQSPPDFSLEKIISNILLGPSTSSPLATLSVGRMLEVIDRPELKDKLIASSIPLRAT